MKLDWNDIALTPEAVTDIQSRFKDINLEYMPLFTAPMDTVVNMENAGLFEELGINLCLPRHAESHHNYLESNKHFRSMSLSEFIQSYLERDTQPQYNICIDTANGHINTLYDSVRKFKDKYGESVKIMAGNIANPYAIRFMDEAGVDYVRCGIGGGSACTTSANSSIHYPMASLIMECAEQAMDRNIKIVADGGFRNFDDIIKALALGADYVMLGGIFNKALESCGETFAKNIDHGSWKEAGDKVDQYSETTRNAFENGVQFYKKYRGMSTKEVQREWGTEETKVRTAEGISKINQVEYTLSGWVENFDHYLRSAMSYCNAHNLEEFIGEAQWNQISPAAYQRFHK